MPITALKVLEEDTNAVTALGVEWSTGENIYKWNCCRKNKKGRGLFNKVRLLQIESTLCWEKSSSGN